MPCNTEDGGCHAREPAWLFILQHIPAAVGCKGTFTLAQASLPCISAPQSSLALQVDLTYVEAAAKAAKAGGVRHFSLVTSKGASARLPAPRMAGLHPLLYLATKGRAEEAVKAQVQRGLATWLTCVHWDFPAVACCMSCVGHRLLTCILSHFPLAAYMHFEPLSLEDLSEGNE